jgi:hypothetical protein
MTATTVVCPECGSPVAPGRLSCQSCGTLLASVVGSGRSPLWATTPQPSEIDEDRPLASAQAVEPEPDPSPVTTAEAAPLPKRGPRRLPRPKVPSSTPPAKGRYVKSPLPDAPPPIDQTALFGPVPNVAPPILHDWSDPPLAAAAATAPAAAAVPAATDATGRDALGAAVPVAGMYLAPSATYAAPIAPTSAPPRPASPAAAPSWPPALPAMAAGTAGGNGASAHAASDPAAPAVVAPTGGTARRLADWLVIGGSTLVLVSFVLPWATNGVIGAVGNGYTSDWGLANPGHLLLVVAAAALLILELVDGPLPGWFRSGVLPLVVGGLMAGLAFAYYARPAGGGAGVAVMLAGALVLIAGGLLASRPERNATAGPSV